MSAPQRKNREPLNQVTDATDGSSPVQEVPNGIERVAIDLSHDAIARRAYQFFEERGGEPGQDWEDWFRAEFELSTSRGRE